MEEAALLLRPVAHVPRPPRLRGARRQLEIARHRAHLALVAAEGVAPALRIRVAGLTRRRRRLRRLSSAGRLRGAAAAAGSRRRNRGAAGARSRRGAAASCFCSTWRRWRRCGAPAVWAGSRRRWSDREGTICALVRRRRWARALGRRRRGAGGGSGRRGGGAHRDFGLRVVHRREESVDVGEGEVVP